tara:strand:- start:321 stop:530 length:210 start_codon:yes stop_codon:yes gene_type:complete
VILSQLPTVPLDWREGEDCATIAEVTLLDTFFNFFRGEEGDGDSKDMCTSPEGGRGLILLFEEAEEDRA